MIILLISLITLSCLNILTNKNNISIVVASNVYSRTDRLVFVGTSYKSHSFKHLTCDFWAGLYILFWFWMFISMHQTFCERFFDPFTMMMWSTILVSFFIIAAALMLIEKLSPFGCHGEFVQTPHNMNIICR